MSFHGEQGPYGHGYEPWFDERERGDEGRDDPSCMTCCVVMLPVLLAVALAVGVVFWSLRKVL